MGCATSRTSGANIRRILVGCGSVCRGGERDMALSIPGGDFRVMNIGISECGKLNDFPARYIALRCGYIEVRTRDVIRFGKDW